jgi:cyclophilin family peptidyl-prolyl cis-trans isomerase
LVQGLRNKKRNTTDPAPPADQPNPAPRSGRKLAVIALALAAAVIILLFWGSLAKKRVPLSESPDRRDVPEGHTATDTGGSLLQQMGQDKPPDLSDVAGPIATTQQLEDQYSAVAENAEQLSMLRNQAESAAKSQNTDEMKQDVERAKPVLAQLEARLATFEKGLTAARRAKPEDPVLQWLTGELLITVGAEPEEILPYLNRAVSAHLERPRLFASLARVEFDLNHFQPAYSAATKAIAWDPHSQTAWEMYSRAGFALEKFTEVLQKVDVAFPANAPAWALAIRRNAGQLQTSWMREAAQRQQDQRRGDLPLVRLMIEHRKFAADGNQSQSVKVAGRGDVEIELFEDQAPSTVSNFIRLVESGFYNGTSFYWAQAGHMVVGGDPNTKNADPADDGLGGPGYVIPDEFNSPSARGHFRGTISMVQNAPGGAGSQFFITLVPAPEFDGYSTAFGRVIKGQEVLDQVTEGRTNRNVGSFGKIIPGDLITRAEVVRKRPHPYVVRKLSPQ